MVKVISHKDSPPEEKYLITSTNIGMGSFSGVRLTVTYMDRGYPITVTRFYSPADYEKYVMNVVLVNEELSGSELRAILDAGEDIKES